MSQFKNFVHRLSISFGIALIGLSIVPAPATVYAATTNPKPAARVSFAFDDGFATTITQAAPILAKYGFAGTSYVPTSCIGMTTVPNTCHADVDKKYMTWNQVAQLKNTYKWEIGSHTDTHPYLASSDANDGQPNVLTPQQVQTELSQSRAALAARGITDTTIATPYGDYDKSVLAQIAKYYPAHRGFADTGYNVWPNSDYLIRTQQVQVGVSVAKVKQYIDAAVANNQWLVLTFHDIKKSGVADYDYKTSDLDKIAAYVKQKNVPVTTVRQGLVTSDTNLLANGSFNSGITSGWSTDNPNAFKLDSSTNGSYPDPTNSIKMTAAASSAHLFSPQVDVNSNSSYLLKNFVSTQTRTSGELGFYIDEYDINGNWVSGQYKAAQREAFVENINFAYKPSSANVTKASLQVILPGGSGITGYLDNVQWVVTQAGAVVTPTNLLPNSTFDNGIAAGWSTDSTTSITANSQNFGAPANAVNSIKLTSGSSNAHLFAPQIAVTAGKQYTLSCYLNITANTAGAIGFYIDEYDVNGNWISGQYKATVSQVGSGRTGFAYIPSSSQVSKASLQVIVSANTGTTAYFDDPTWY